ncbi:hypothetical protein AB4Y88_18635 [Paenarthrobacter sp. RAF9]
MVEALSALAEPDAARHVSVECKEWASCFTWDRSTRLLTGVLLEEEKARREGGDLRSLHSDLSTLVRFELPAGADLRAVLRATDEVALTDDGHISVMMKGRDEFEAFAALKQIGVETVELRPAGPNTLLAGPGSSFAPVDAVDGQ